MRSRFLVPPAMRAGYKGLNEDTTIKKSMKDVGGGVKNFFKDNLDPRDPIFKLDEKAGKNINNLYTGYKLGGKGNLLVGGSMLGGGTLIVSNPKLAQDHYNRGNIVEAESQEQDIESMQSTRGDMAGYRAAIGAEALANLQTSGDLVFAMHKTRHSGQL